MPWARPSAARSRVRKRPAADQGGSPEPEAPTTSELSRGCGDAHRLGRPVCQTDVDPAGKRAARRAPVFLPRVLVARISWDSMIV
jgi:hypothetical protein